MTKVLIIAEHDGEKLNSSTAKTLTCALAIDAASVEIAVLGGPQCDAVCDQAAALDGVARVVKLAREENSAPVAAVFAPQVVELAAGYTHLIAPSTTFGKDLMPRVAALLGVPSVTDVMKVISPDTFERPIYAGNAIDTVQLAEDVSVMVGTARPASFKAAELGSAAAPIEAVETSAALPDHSRYIELRQQASDRPDLQSATKVVSGGRGVGSGDNFDVIYALADKLGAAAGASRAAVDAGFVANDMQVGQTGKVIAPDLYIACGISGAIQHLAGIKDAGTIVAINSDADAPIFEVADLGIVGDLFTLVPELEKALP
ncbi:MAG: FAD-binding protein [Gammaproteobacteria bacterium]